MVGISIVKLRATIKKLPPEFGRLYGGHGQKTGAKTQVHKQGCVQVHHHSKAWRRTWRARPKQGHQERGVYARASSPREHNCHEGRRRTWRARPKQVHRDTRAHTKVVCARASVPRVSLSFLRYTALATRLSTCFIS